MSDSTAVGLYGKLPGHGDFISRNLSSSFVQHWDAWLQAFIGSSQERLGQDWLTIYLTSPIWRFAFSEGVLDEHQWLGILLPSVDKVGRYFPFSLLFKVPSDNSLSELIHSQSAWFTTLENAALNALDEALTVDELLDELTHFAAPPNSRQIRNALPQQAGSLLVLDHTTGENIASTSMYLLDGLLGASFSSYSLWATQGSDRVEPCQLVTPGLPNTSQATALLDGNWQTWQWTIPFVPTGE